MVGIKIETSQQKVWGTNSNFIAHCFCHWDNCSISTYIQCQILSIATGSLSLNSHATQNFTSFTGLHDYSYSTSKSCCQPHNPCSSQAKVFTMLNNQKLSVQFFKELMYYQNFSVSILQDQVKIAILIYLLSEKCNQFCELIVIKYLWCCKNDSLNWQATCKYTNLSSRP